MGSPKIKTRDRDCYPVRQRCVQASKPQILESNLRDADATSACKLHYTKLCIIIFVLNC